MALPQLKTDRMSPVGTELTNDHKALSKAMDALLQQLHALHKPQNGHGAAYAATSSKPLLCMAAPGDAPHMSASQQRQRRPFARIDEVSPDSPATTTGLQVTPDLVCSAQLSFTVGELSDFLTALLA
jgi:hypothetical protein